MIIVNVILPLPLRKFFSYIMPDSITPIIGGRVVVPVRKKDIIGIIVSINQKNNINSLNFKCVKYAIDSQPILNISLLNTLLWLSNYYHYPIGRVFLFAMPKFFKFENVKFHDEFDLNENMNQINLSLFRKKIFINNKILLKIHTIFRKNFFSSWLISESNLYTKIKFYLGLFQKILSKKLQILILVPLIKDAYKIFFFLKKYFNITIDIIHSNLTDNKFFDLLIKTKNGQNSIIIGTKQSIFFSFLQLGLIVVIEEHNLIYKNINTFKCNIVNIATLRAYKDNIPIILDSQTPSLKTVYNIIQKKIFWINFNKKDNFLILKHEIIDLKKEKIKTGLSETLINKIFENIKKHFSVLLIFNKSDFFYLGLICSNCKWIPKCNVCQNDYEINKYNNLAFCSYCLITVKIPLFCYNCNFFSLTQVNLGIKKIKNNIKNIFPNIPLLFLTNLKNIKANKFSAKINNFSILHSGIIISTEKIARHYYFPNVRLIGLVNIDHYFFSLNFYNIEYFAQFYYNIINLVQKNSKSFNVLIQTSIPNNINLINICNTKYSSFALDILNVRKKFFLPPWSFQVTLYCTSKDSHKSYNFLKFIYIFFKKKSKQNNILFWFVGPEFVILNSKKKGYKLLIQCSSRVYLQKILRISIEVARYFSIFNSIEWYLDF